jgi:FkbM family methyltransferase
MLPIRTSLSAILRHYPFHIGYEAIGLSKPLAMFARNEHFGIAYLRNGMKMLVFGKDHVGRILLYMGDFEPAITHIAKILLRPGDTVIDIGSNLGWFTLTAAAHVGDRGKIHAFDPQPAVNTLARATILMNGLENVTLHEVALSDAVGTAELHVLKGNFGAARLSKETGNLWSKIDVPTVQAGDYLKSLSLTSVRLLKIDVEGHEQTIFQAAEDFLTQMPPEIIVFESASDQPLLDRPIAKTISALGYKIFSIEKSLFSTKLIPAGAGQQIKTIDHVAFYDGPSLQADLAAMGLR